MYVKRKRINTFTTLDVCEERDSQQVIMTFILRDFVWAVSRVSQNVFILVILL